MQISSKEIIFLITLSTLIFLIAPVFLIIYVSTYNKKKAKHLKEKESLKRTFEIEMLKAQVELQEHLMQSIASDLHDNIGQLLSLTSITLSSVKAGNIEDEKINTARDLTLRSIKELRALSKMMNGQQLLKKNLGHAIAYELEWLKKGADYEINFTDQMTHSIPAHSDKELLIFRLFQEILSNIIKHAEATTITIILDQTTEFISLSVKDNGKGFILEEKLSNSDGLGLSNLSKRAAMMSGTFSINSVPGSGTEIRMLVPYI